MDVFYPPREELELNQDGRVFKEEVGRSMLRPTSVIVRARSPGGTPVPRRRNALARRVGRRAWLGPRRDPRVASARRCAQSCRFGLVPEAHGVLRVEAPAARRRRGWKQPLGMVYAGLDGRLRPQTCGTSRSPVSGCTDSETMRVEVEPRFRSSAGSLPPPGRSRPAAHRQAPPGRDHHVATVEIRSPSTVVRPARVRRQLASPGG